MACAGRVAAHAVDAEAALAGVGRRAALAVVRFANAHPRRAVVVGRALRVSGAGARARCALADIRVALRVRLIDAGPGSIADLPVDRAVRACAGPATLAERSHGTDARVA